MRERERGEGERRARGENLSPCWLFTGKEDAEDEEEEGVGGVVMAMEENSGLEWRSSCSMMETFMCFFIILSFFFSEESYMRERKKTKTRKT